MVPEVCMSGESRLKVDRRDHVTIVGFKDASILDATTIRHIGRELYAIVTEEPNRRVVLDFSDVRFLSSQALGVLLTLRRKADQAGAIVALASIRPELVRVFKITNLDQLFQFYATAAQAVEAFGQDGATSPDAP
ncbi:MAG: anti-sigma factor antagonist [Planctomycetota bacterium]|nr:MAG: anti-sigma factor antagonist [Planctomycetota bacterium]